MRQHGRRGCIPSAHPEDAVRELLGSGGPDSMGSEGSMSKAAARVRSGRCLAHCSEAAKPRGSPRWCATATGMASIFFVLPPPLRASDPHQEHTPSPGRPSASPIGYNPTAYGTPCAPESRSPDEGIWRNRGIRPAMPRVTCARTRLGPSRPTPSVRHLADCPGYRPVHPPCCGGAAARRSGEGASRRGCRGSERAPRLRGRIWGLHPIPRRRSPSRGTGGSSPDGHRPHLR